LEAASEITRSACEGRFAYAGSETTTAFTIRTNGTKNPVEAVIRFLLEAQVAVLVPTDSAMSFAKWDDLPTEPAPFMVSPSPVPKTPATPPVKEGSGKKAARKPGTSATLPASLKARDARLIIDYWADGPHCGRDNVKFWAGAGGYPGAALARDAIEAVRRAERTSLVDDPFSAAAQMSSSFRFDWRRDYIPLDVGFSPNKHSSISMIGYPLTELLAAIGMKNARPSRVTKLEYRYGISSAFLPASLSRIVLGAVDIGFPMRTFKMILGWPGKENQARCIIDAREEF
jgi:CRISPR-associated protein Csx14